MRLRSLAARALPIPAVAAVLLAGSGVPAADLPPKWAYGTEVSGPAAAGSDAAPAMPDHGVKHLPGSGLGFTLAQIGNPFGPADWYPGDHPEMPEIVAFGRKPGIWACSLCHYPNGKGRPENAGVAALPVSYFVHQMNDFRNGLRKSADPGKKNTALMIAYARGMTEAEIKAAAEYFGSMRWTRWIRVVETDSVPKTRLSVGMYLPLEGKEREPIGRRIIEMPEEPERTEELRDPRSGFIAYVPFGAVKKGEVLVKTGIEGSAPCAACHGAELKGMGPVPGIAGRSPSYVARQLYDMQQGDRRGEWTELMRPVVSGLSNEDILNIAAYTASLRP